MLRNSKGRGPHFNPDMKQHGLQNAMGPHYGDMNNFVVAANGTARKVLLNPRVTMATGASSSIVRLKADTTYTRLKADPTYARVPTDVLIPLTGVYAALTD
jgi:superoxide dismutase, Cu-Zn family